MARRAEGRGGGLRGRRSGRLAGTRDPRGVWTRTPPVWCTVSGAGVVAIQQTVDTDTGEVLEEPVVLARFGDLPAEFNEG